jgi:tetratricopeptide (TPR) repeat protein
MEHKGRGELAEAWAVFSELLAQFADYVPSYLMAGGTLAALGRAAEAADVYRRGIEAATRKGDSHARGELETALTELEQAQENVTHGASATPKPAVRMQ